MSKQYYISYSAQRDGKNEDIAQTEFLGIRARALEKPTDEYIDDPNKSKAKTFCDDLQFYPAFQKVGNEYRFKVHCPCIKGGKFVFDEYPLLNGKKYVSVPARQIDDTRKFSQIELKFAPADGGRPVTFKITIGLFDMKEIVTKVLNKDKNRWEEFTYYEFENLEDKEYATDFYANTTFHKPPKERPAQFEND